MTIFHKYRLCGFYNLDWVMRAKSPWTKRKYKMYQKAFSLVHWILALKAFKKSSSNHCYLRKFDIYGSRVEMTIDRVASGTDGPFSGCERITDPLWDLRAPELTDLLYSRIDEDSLFLTGSLEKVLWNQCSFMRSELKVAEVLECCLGLYLCVLRRK